jgi:hypothetical protein
MTKGVHWISNGQAGPAPEAFASPAAERQLLQRQGYVKIVENESGTTLRWSMFSANWSSLFFVAEWVHGSVGPFHLQYYSAGWFNERFDHAHTAAERIHHLINKSDVHLSQTVYIRSAPDARKDVPPLLSKVLRDMKADEECSIDCTYDPSSQRFRVARVSENSTIAKLWGVNPVSYPCLTGHSYDHAVSRIYPQVTRTGEPHHDHIYAAMASANGDVVWVPYQRVVLPLNLGRNRKAVRVVTELAKVDISPL